MSGKPDTSRPSSALFAPFFRGQLDLAAKEMDLGVRKKPKSVCMWANRWAKHRLQILLQHHPLMAFADQYGERPLLSWSGTDTFTVITS